MISSTLPVPNGERPHSSSRSAQIELPTISTSNLTTEEDIMADDHHFRSAVLMKGSSMDPLNPPCQSYSSSYLRSWCTFQHFCYCVQFVNCILVCTLIALAMQEYPKIEELEQQVEADKEEIASLEKEVNEKQQGQIQALNNEVEQEQEFNFLTLAGTFTLLTCLISMFHISTHLQKMNQPKIQRKIIAILWMSPIYSVTSFFTLWFPSIGGWMAIIKDFYEAYCIYTFLSFLIVVLGHGSREQAVNVLAKHAHHLEEPTRCLSCLYEHPPGASNHAKANAVVTQCQIYGMQFTFLRPLTTVIYVLINRHRVVVSDSSSSTSNNNDSSASSNGNMADATSSTDGDTAVAADSTTNHGNHSGTRMLRQQTNTAIHIPSRRWLQDEGESDDGGSSNTNSSSVADTDTDNSIGDDTTWIPSPSPIEGSFGATFAPSLISSLVTSIVPTMVGSITGVNNTITGPTGGSEIMPTLSPTMWPTMSSDEEGEANDLYDSTVAYFKSPGFALAMVVNVSVFFAFTGLLKFYHAVRDDLAWCRPWPKFLTIKGVVFLTFWQGLLIVIFVVVLADPSEKEDATYRAVQYQNVIICVEMLLFSISHWCVFPAEEWEPNYQPKKMETPGMGIKDFVHDVGHIVQNRSGRSRKTRRRISRRKKGSPTANIGGIGSSDYGGLYQQPEMNPSNTIDSDDEDDNKDNVDSNDQGLTVDDSTSRESFGRHNVVRFEDPPSPGGIGSLAGDVRDRSMSDGTGCGFKADDELDSDDMELL